MRVEEALRAHLLDDPAVSALVADRVYPMLLPPDDPTFPAVTYRRISDPRTGTHDQGRGRAPVLHRPRLQIDAYGRDNPQGGTSGYDVAWALADAITACLEGFQGNLGGVTGPYVGMIQPQGAMDDYDSQMDWFRVHQDVFVWINEEVPV